MMYKLIILFVIEAALAATNPSNKPNPLEKNISRPPQKAPPIQIISQTKTINPDGSYKWSYESENGIAAEEKSELLNDAVVVSGGFQYKSSDGSPISLTYIADENGFRAFGDHLPVAPTIPPIIARALEWIAAHTPSLDKK